MSVSLADNPATGQTRTHAAPPATPGLGFRPDIEGLRAVAVGVVVLGHAGVPLLSGGYVGVDVFFVISGFLITSLLLKERSGTGRISIKGFYARRATRLLPASALVVVATLVAAWLWLPATRFASIVWDAVASAFYLVNYRLAVEGTEYLNAEAAPSPLQHFWSLAVEEQYYFVWPVLLIVLTAAWRRGGFSRKPVAAVLAVIVVASLALSVLQTSASPSWAYFGIQTRAWELAAGALIAVTAVRLARLTPWLAAVVTWLGLAAIAASALLYGETTAYPGYAALLPVAGAVAVIAGGCARPKAGAQLLLGTGPFQFVGKISYGYYLWHWPVLMIGPAALGVAPSVKVNLVLIAGALLISVISFHVVENPIRHRKTLKARPWRGLALGAALTAATAAVTALALVFPPAVTGTGTGTDTADAVTGSDDPETELAELIDASVTKDSVPANLTPALTEADADRPKSYDEGCHLDPEVVELPGPCTFGDPEGDKTMVLIGDSHAAQWFPALDAIAADWGWRLVSRTKGFCSPPTVTVYNAEAKRDYTECDQWRDTTLDEIANLKPDMVIMSASDADGNQPLHVDDPDKAWADGWVDAAQRLASDDTELVHISDTPWAKTNIPECLATNLDSVTECTQSTDDAIRQPERRQGAIEALKPLNVTEIDPLDWFCSADGRCPVIVGDLLVYRDGHHMTTDYAEMLVPILEPELPKP